MGGKAKQAQRTKNNSRPSNSGRSAELLGSSIPSFVGFSAHSGLGILPLAPGFLLEPLPDNFDASINPQYQVVLRKMSKKDPVTKVKALQEFTELVTTSDLATVKTILPLWPKFYHSVANDVEHRVRESAQQAQSAVVEIAGKHIAPYLKHLAPVWITSQFDNYAPAANIASYSFKKAFSPKKLQEVFIFCQNEILEYVTKNLTVHTASTLCTSKTYTEEEATNKYNRVVVCNLRAYALFLETIPSDKVHDVDSKNEVLLQSQKFWSFAKHKLPSVRAAWFEALYSILQNADHLLENSKQQAITLVFQNMGDTDPLVVPQVWGCILLIQNKFDDWHNSVNFKKVILPKLMLLLKTGGNGNGATTCPHYLPFLSKLSDECMQGYPLDDFYNDFFRTIKTWFTSTHDGLISKSDLSANIIAFYECLRYVIQKKALENSQTIEKIINYSQNLLEEYVVDTIKWSVVNENIISKYLYTQISSLILFWAQNSNSSKIYAHLIEKFWFHLLNNMKSSEMRDVDEIQSQRLVDFIESLFNASLYPQDNKVKFDVDEDVTDNPKPKGKQIDPILHTDLRKICIELAKLFIEKTTKEKSPIFIIQLKTLCHMFNEVDFYLKISSQHTLTYTVNILMRWLEHEKTTVEPVIDIIFDILYHLEKKQRLDYLNILLLESYTNRNKMEFILPNATEMTNYRVQQWILQRFLSYPLCIEPEIRTMLAQSHISAMIVRIAKEAIHQNCKEKFNLLHKCFFQNDAGDILINKVTVESIIEIISEPLVNPFMFHMLDTCGSFIAQIMPVMCSGNATRGLLRETFIKLFNFSVNTTEIHNLSEDTLWEITTCWQDALSSGDIVIDDELLAVCARSMFKGVIDSECSTLSYINNIADIAAKLALCSTEKILDEEDRYKRIDAILKIILHQYNTKDNFEEIENFCSYLECLQNVLTSTDLNPISVIDEWKINIYFRAHLFKFSTVYKLTCNIRVDTKSDENKDTDTEEEHEYTEDYCDPNENIIKIWSEHIYELIMNSMRVAAVGESLLLNSYLLSEDTESLVLNLSEKIKLLLTCSSKKLTTSFKEKLLLKISEGGRQWARTISILLASLYSNSENGAVLLYEDSIDYMIEKKQMLSYLNILQIMYTQLPLKCLPIKPDLFSEDVDILIRAGSIKAYIQNHFSGDYAEMSDKKLVSYCFNIITDAAALQQSTKQYLLYDQDISEVPLEKVMVVAEFANFLAEVLIHFPTELNMKHWDLIRIALSSWVLTISKNIENTKLPQVAIFIGSIYRLYAAMSTFITEEKTKSSTEMLTNIIDEWENFFAKEINLVLFKTFFNLVSSCDNKSCDYALLDVISPHMEFLDYTLILNASKSGFKITLDDIIRFILEQLSCTVHSVRVACAGILHKLIDSLVAMDVEKLENRTESIEYATDEWHLLYKMTSFIEEYGILAEEYLSDFSYKLTEIADLTPVDQEEMLPFLLFWDCIIEICSKAPAELRSFYANWITESQYEQTVLHFLIRCMPIEILKNYDSKVINNDMFKMLTWQQIQDRNLTIERYSCHIYAQMLRYLPAVVRKWWNAANPREKTFVDKLTTNYVSSLICQEELRAITSKKEKHENMQVTVHTSTREVIATYSIDEVCMELAIALAPNHPLGSVKVESEKQIGGRLQSRVVVRQLTIFLTHQNGSIFDGLSLWKKNLDKKFEGVEECFVCYSVIHQDTCQLPKLSCKTCRKKFHGPCLYKWFTTSSKSTCPICRNVF